MPPAHPRKTNSENRSETIIVLLMGATSLIGLALFTLFRLHVH